jgi:hypothetical protein
MPDEKVAAAILVAVQAFLEEEEASQAKPAIPSWWSYNGRIMGASRQLAWMRRPR